MADQTTITVHRRSRYTDMFRAYRVVVDDEAVGRVRRDETQAFAVTPGRHRVWLTLDWCRSEVVELDVEPGEEVRLECRSRGVWSALWASLTAPDRYMLLERVPG